MKTSKWWLILNSELGTDVSGDFPAPVNPLIAFNWNAYEAKPQKLNCLTKPWKSQKYNDSEHKTMNNEHNTSVDLLL